MDERVEGDLTNKVGYAKPPKHTRFTKGRSGNPKGRPTGSKNLATMMIEELTQTVARHRCQNAYELWPSICAIAYNLEASPR